MFRFAIATLVDATRSLLAFVVLAVAVNGALYVGVHPFSRTYYNPCSPHLLMICIGSHSSRAPWQIPVAVAIGVVGFGLAGVIACWRRGRPERALPIPVEWPVRRIAV